MLCTGRGIFIKREMNGRHVEVDEGSLKEEKYSKHSVAVMDRVLMMVVKENKCKENKSSSESKTLRTCENMFQRISKGSKV